MNWIKNIMLVVVSIAATIVSCNFLVGIYLNYYKSTNSVLNNSNKIKLYRKYENQLNHLRNPAIGSIVAPHLIKDTDLIFSKLSQQNASISVLISGDSWAENFATDLESYQTLKNFSKSERINLILSGTSSYSPTLLGIQSRILKNVFDLSFDQIEDLSRAETFFSVHNDIISFTPPRALSYTSLKIKAKKKNGNRSVEWVSINYTEYK